MAAFDDPFGISDAPKGPNLDAMPTEGYTPPVAQPEGEFRAEPDSAAVFQSLVKSVGPTALPKSSATGAFLHAAERGIVPSLTGMAAAGPAAEGAAALSLPVAPFAGPFAPAVPVVAGVVGGVAGFWFGSTAASVVQDHVLSAIPMSAQQALGQDPLQAEAERTDHSTAQFIGDLAPTVLTMSPFGAATKALPEGASRIAKVFNNPVAARLTSGAFMAGNEAIGEYRSGEEIDPIKVAISTSLGLIFPHPNRLGRALNDAFVPTRPNIEKPGDTIDPQFDKFIKSSPRYTDGKGNPLYMDESGKPTISPTSTPMEPDGKGGYRDGGISRPNRYYEPPITPAQLSDSKVAGPGITEEVFHGTQAQSPSTEAAARAAAQQEAKPQAPDIHETARRMEPDLFTTYDGLSAKRDMLRARIEHEQRPPDEASAPLEAQRQELQTKLDAHRQTMSGTNNPLDRQLRAQIRDAQTQIDNLQVHRDAFDTGQADETPNVTALRQKLMETDVTMRDMAPEVSAAYRRAAEAHGTETVAPSVGESRETIAPQTMSEAGVRSDAQPQEQPLPSVLDAGQQEGSAQPPIGQEGALHPHHSIIAEDVTRQLIAAGRPADEARAAGELVAAHTITRAQRFNGALGTPLELHGKEGATIQGRYPPPAPRIEGVPLPAAPAAPTPQMARVAQEMEAVATHHEGTGFSEVGKISEVSANALPGTPNEPAGVFMFDATQLNVDSNTFQFKSGGDEYGVTGALKSVTKWDKTKASAIIVWQRADGKLFVADGHQRSGLARRLVATGKEKNIELPGLLLREKDGFTAADARAKAAVTNIANGTGSALDGAKILRSRPDLLDGSLPLAEGKGKQAAALARLDDEAFRMVVNEVVPEHQAAIVGDFIPNDGPRQIAAMKAIARFEPKNTEETVALVQRVAQAELAKAEAGRQTSMFGDLETAESTAGQEMQIVGRTIKEMNKDKTLFTRILANADKIEQTGSVIERGSAEAIASDSEKFAKILSSSAYSAGPIRNELVQAAKELRNGETTIREASARIVAAIRREVEANGGSGLGMGERAATQENQANTEGNGLKPNERELAQPTKELFQRPAALRQTSGPSISKSPDGTFENLVSLVRSNAPIHEIEADPYMQSAVRQMEAVPLTEKQQGFMSDSWKANRTYDFPGGQVQGYDNAIDRLTDAAKDFSTEGPVLKERKATILLGPPASGKSTYAEKYATARRAAIVDSDEAKKIIPEFDRGIGTNAVHEESAIMAADIQRKLMSEGANIVIPKVGHNPSGIAKMILHLKANGYTVDLIGIKTSYDNAFRRMVGRFASTGRLIDPEYVRFVGEKPSETYQTLRQQGVADRYAEIDNNAPKGQKPKILNDTGATEGIQGLGGSGEQGSGTIRASDGQEVRTQNVSREFYQRDLLSEKGAEGLPQTLLPGVEPSTLKQRLELEANKPMRGGNKAAGGMFDEGAQKQKELFQRSQRNDAWKSTEITATTDTGETIKLSAGWAVDHMLKRIEAAKQLLDCVNAG